MGMSKALDFITSPMADLVDSYGVELGAVYFAMARYEAGAVMNTFFSLLYGVFMIAFNFPVLGLAFFVLVYLWISVQWGKLKREELEILRRT